MITCQKCGNSFPASETISGDKGTFCLECYNKMTKQKLYCPFCAGILEHLKGDKWLCKRCNKIHYPYGVDS